MNNNIKLPEAEKARQTALYKSLLACFRYGKANAVHLNDLKRYAELDGRRLRKMIELLRRDGICICSDEAGYYRPETAEELESYIKIVEATAKSTFYTLRTAKAELAKMQNQEPQQLTISEIINNIIED